MAIEHLNNGTECAPGLRLDISWLNLWDLPEWSNGPKGTDHEKLAAIQEAGYKGVQGADPALCRELGLPPTAMGNIQQVGQMEPVCRELQDAGYDLITIHAGCGLEDDDDAFRLIEDILSASSKTGFPVYIETHRATLTQDIWRTVKLIEKFPEIRINADYSHWYSGLEMTNGDWERKMAFLQPVFDRTCFMHGRIGNSSHIQVDIGDGTNRKNVDDFRDLWTRTFKAFLATAKPGDYLPFAPELLPPCINYAREFPGPDGTMREESDRWEQAKVLSRIARECFTTAETKP